MTKPLILLDFDGVINPVGRKTPYGDTLSADVVMSETRPRNHKIFYSPTVIATLLDWQNRGLAEIKWLSAWGNDADGDLRLALGINSPFGALGHPPTQGGERGCDEVKCRRWWKLCAARGEYLKNGRKFVWIDDDLDNKRALKWLDTIPADDFLRIHTNSYRGLMPEHLDEIERTLVAWSAEAQAA